MKIHMLGIGGTGMGSLAGLLTEAGHTVTGTDEEIYPPMSDQLEALGIMPYKGYAAENLDRAAPDLAIIGNVIRRENPEAQEVMRRDIPYRSMPSALSELFLAERTPLVITGTHGKTTSATLAAWLLEHAGEKPGFLVGGVGKNLGRSYEIGKGPVFIVEGDEYDSAFFDKGPKFLHYRPQALIITSIEFDHADIYDDVEQITRAFRRLVPMVPPDGIIVMNAEDEKVMALRRLARARIVTYGIDCDADYRPEDVRAGGDGTSFKLRGPDKGFTLPMWGRHNLLNCTGVLAALLESGVDADKLAAGLPTFEGIARRQELKAVINGVSVIDDFAHHPTAVATTIDSMRLRFPGGRIWAIFEPRSNTSRRNIFQREYARALAHADRVIVASPFKSEAIPEDERFDSRAVADTIMRTGKDSHHIDDTEHIIEFVMRGVENDDVLLVMSNGDFDGLIAKLMDALKGRRTYSSSDEVPYSRVRK